MILWAIGRWQGTWAALSAKQAAQALDGCAIGSLAIPSEKAATAAGTLASALEGSGKQPAKNGLAEGAGWGVPESS